MPTNHNETLHERYSREHEAGLAIFAKMKTGEICDMNLQLHNSRAELDKLHTELGAARGLLESAVVLFACHCTDATAKTWHDDAGAFLTATPAPEVPDHIEHDRAMAEPGERQEAIGYVAAGAQVGAVFYSHLPLPVDGAKLYTSPPPAQDVSGLVEALEHYANCGRSGNVARVALAAHRQAQRPGQVNRCPTCTGTCAEICAKARP